MIKLGPKTKTLICIGTGGVGKTTMAASLAVGFAREGKKVLVLTIDPSLRLAQTLGIAKDGSLQEVPIGPDTKGKLYACIIDHKKTFEDFIRSASASVDVDKLLNNKLYQQLSTKLNGSQEFTSLIKLYQYSRSDNYDLVILDTPPSQHTWNFLRAPEKISALFNEGIAVWFRQADDKKQGLIKKIWNLGSTQVLKALEVLTGSQFMSELAAFFRAIQSKQAELGSYMNGVHRLLTSVETEFLLVTNLDSSRLQEAEKLTTEIQKEGYRLSTVIVNRVPLWSSYVNTDLKSSKLKQLCAYYSQMETKLSERLTRFKRTLKVYKCAELRQNSQNVENLYDNFKSIQEAR